MILKRNKLYMAIIRTAVIVMAIIGGNTAVANTTTVHKWVDENGVVHFSNKKDTPAEAEKVEVEHGQKTRFYRKNTKFTPYKAPKQKKKYKKSANKNRQHNQCELWQKQIDQIDANLRKKHSSKYGTQMEERRWKIRKKMHDKCYGIN